MNPRHVAIVGATGAVGQELLDVLARRAFPVASLRLLASPRSAGRRLRFAGEEIPVEPLGATSFRGTDIAIFSAGGGTAKEWAPKAVADGAVVVDNSSAFRMEPGVPLVIPEINASTAKDHQGIVANPNCTTAVALMALAPLHRAFGLKRVFASSYQAVSGTGAKAIEELRRQISDLAAGRPAAREVYPHQIAFNVLPHVDVFQDNGYTREEMKFVHESRKILGHESLRASMTCVRVPVYRAHAVALSAEFEREPEVAEARDVLAKFPGLRINDDPARNAYPMPLLCAGRDECEVGRLRRDLALENGLALWVCGDQLLKGAALNAVQIAELL